jgi:hypothetical protein
MSGYEMLFQDGKWDFTHRLVARNNSELLTQKETLSSDKLVIHHTSFNKRNNDPAKLQWVDYIDHKKIHAQFNKDLWSDETKTHEYKEKTREGHRKYWTAEKKKNVSPRQRMFMQKFTSALSDDERAYKYGLRGNKNGMFGRGDKLQSSKNGKWNGVVNRPSNIDVLQYEKDLIGGISVKQLKTKYNILREDCKNLNREICKKYNVKWWKFYTFICYRM